MPFASPRFDEEIRIDTENSPTALDSEQQVIAARLLHIHRVSLCCAGLGDQSVPNNASASQKRRR